MSDGRRESKRHLAWLAWVAAATGVACTQPTLSSHARLVGTHDLVLVDQLGEGDSLAARADNPNGGPQLMVGVPSRFLFITSGDSNELRVLENFRPGIADRGFARAPNPLETLSIPVLEHPTMLVADEGRNAQGVRVTGSYVYAARPGGEEISVVSITRRRQLGGKPFATPGPVTAIGAFMEVDASKPALATPLPSTTRLLVATWDGELASVHMAELPTNSPHIDRLDFKRLVLIPDAPIAALHVLPPLATRTLDGMPFCATKACLVLATRRGRQGGETILFEPETSRSVPLAFGGAVRLLASSTDLTRIYGVLDEEGCGGPSCGGVVAVDVAEGSSAAGFPGAVDALGLPMRPMRSNGLITGLSIAAGAKVQQTVETPSADGGSTGLSYVVQEYRQLGAYSASNGVITFFSGFGGSIIDFDGRRTTVASATVRTPGQSADGGDAFVGEDGGTLGSSIAAKVAVDQDLSKTYRTASVSTDDGVWQLDISDGYLATQALVVVNQGQIPGLTSLPRSSDAGSHLAIPAEFSSRAASGDSVRFESGHDVGGFRECGQSQVTLVGQDFVEVAVPPSCQSATRFSVRAGGSKPLVVVGDVEGYLGRVSANDTLTYSRPYVLLAAGVTAPRPALTLKVPSVVPRGVGAYIEFQIQGNMSPHQISFDTAMGTGISCSTQLQLQGQMVLGNLVMAQTPTTTTANSAIDFRWSLFGVLPSAEGIAEVNLSRTEVGSLGPASGVVCWR